MRTIILQHLGRGVALALALGVGSYVVFCRGSAPRSDGASSSGSQQELRIADPDRRSVAEEQIAEAPNSCEELALEIRRFDMFMTTSKSGPSPADLQRLDVLRARYARHCE